MFEIVPEPLRQTGQFGSLPQFRVSGEFRFLQSCVRFPTKKGKRSSMKRLFSLHAISLFAILILSSATLWAQKPAVEPTAPAVNSAPSAVGDISSASLAPKILE